MTKNTVYTFAGGTFSVYSTIHDSRTKTVSVCPPPNTAPVHWPASCSHTVKSTILVARATSIITVTSYNYTSTITTTSIKYPKTITQPIRDLPNERYTILTETHTTTTYASTVTSTFPLFATPTHFKLRVVSKNPDISNDTYVQEKPWYFFNNRQPGIFPSGNLTTGSLFNITHLYSTTVLGRPRANSTCGAFTFSPDLNYGVTGNQGYLLGCPTNRNGWAYEGTGYDYDVYPAEFLELQHCWIDCFAMLRCAVGLATVWEFGENGYPFSVVQPVDEEDLVWVNSVDTCQFVVVPWK